MSKVFIEMLKDFSWLNTSSFHELIYSLAAQMVELEFSFIDLAYNDNGREIVLEGLDKKDIKDFVKITCNERLVMLGLDPIFNEQKENPLPWFNIMVAGDEHANFFEGRGTGYAKGMNTGSINFNKMEDLFSNLTNLESEKYAELDQE